jgi:hypothetical protein
MDGLVSDISYARWCRVCTEPTNPPSLIISTIFFEKFLDHTQCVRICLPYLDGLHFWAFLSWLSALKGRQYGFSTVLKLYERERESLSLFFFFGLHQTRWDDTLSLYILIFSCVWTLDYCKYWNTCNELSQNPYRTNIYFFFWPNI